MRDLYIGTKGRGARLHLAGLTETGEGFSKCGRRMDDIRAVGEADVTVESPWCASCLAKEVRQAMGWAEADYTRAQRGQGLFRVWPDERSPLGNDGAMHYARENTPFRRLMGCLNVAIDALGDIAADDSDAEDTAREALVKIRSGLGKNGDA